MVVVDPCAVERDFVRAVWSRDACDETAGDLTGVGVQAGPPLAAKAVRPLGCGRWRRRVLRPWSRQRRHATTLRKRCS
eukprot:COSAG02_NODE_3944_length_6003_cov_3.206978_7_plen_78_part_00